MIRQVFISPQDQIPIHCSEVHAFWWHQFSYLVTRKETGLSFNLPSTIFFHFGGYFSNLQEIITDQCFNKHIFTGMIYCMKDKYDIFLWYNWDVIWLETFNLNSLKIFKVRTHNTLKCLKQTNKSRVPKVPNAQYQIQGFCAATPHVALCCSSALIIYQHTFQLKWMLNYFFTFALMMQLGFIISLTKVIK